MSSGNIPDRQALHVKACHQDLLEMSAQGYKLTEYRVWNSGRMGYERRLLSWRVTSPSGGHQGVTDPSTPQLARPINLTSTCADTHCKAKRKARCYQMSEASAWRMHWQGAVGSGALIKAKPVLDYLHNILCPLLGQWTSCTNSPTSQRTAHLEWQSWKPKGHRFWMTVRLTLNDRLKAELCWFGILCGPAINYWLVPDVSLSSPKNSLDGLQPTSQLQENAGIL